MPCRDLSCAYLFRTRLRAYGLDIYHAWAFSVVRLDDLGNARASTCGMGKGESHAFVFIEVQQRFTPRRRLGFYPHL